MARPGNARRGGLYRPAGQATARSGVRLGRLPDRGHPSHPRWAEAKDPLRWIVEGIAGYDLNPLAVLTSRANFLIAIGDLLPRSGPIRIPIYLRDSILESEDARRLPGSSTTWWAIRRGLPGTICQRSTAKRPSLSGANMAVLTFGYGGPAWRRQEGPLHAHDLRRRDRYLKDGGRLAVVITQTLFQTKGAGDGFRRFRLGPDGPPLCVLCVNDLVAARPFPSAANWTATLLLQKGRPTEYQCPMSSGLWRPQALGNRPSNDPRTRLERNGCS